LITVNSPCVAELFYINPGIDALRGSVEVKLRMPIIEDKANPNVLRRG
jgi:hypothetical protein